MSGTNILIKSKVRSPFAISTWMVATQDWGGTSQEGPGWRNGAAQPQWVYALEQGRADCSCTSENPRLAGLTPENVGLFAIWPAPLSLVGPQEWGQCRTCYLLCLLHTACILSSNSNYKVIASLLCDVVSSPSQHEQPVSPGAGILLNQYLSLLNCP